MTILDDMDEPTEAGAVAKLAKLAEQTVPFAAIDTKDGRTFTVTRNDFRLEQITTANRAEVFMPKIVSGNVTLQTAPSLCEYVNRFKNADTVIFADMAGNKIVAVVDYHGAPAANTPSDANAEQGAQALTSASNKPDPRLLAHRAGFQLVFSEQWKVWTGSNDKLFTQVSFADFLEQNGVDVVDPTGADLLEIVSDLDAFSKSTVKTRVRMGAMQNLSFTKDSDVSGSKDGDIAIPNRLKLHIPVYFGEAPVDIDALIRMSVDDGTARFGYKLIRPEQVRQAEFQRIVEDVHGDTDAVTLYGTP